LGNKAELEKGKASPCEAPVWRDDQDISEEMERIDTIRKGYDACHS
jgi:hypothetical protein